MWGLLPQNMEFFRILDMYSKDITLKSLAFRKEKK
jgi:hypothetical protein